MAAKKRTSKKQAPKPKSAEELIAGMRKNKNRMPTKGGGIFDW